MGHPVQYRYLRVRGRVGLVWCDAALSFFNHGYCLDQIFCQNNRCDWDYVRMFVSAYVKNNDDNNSDFFVLPFWSSRSSRRQTPVCSCCRPRTRWRSWRGRWPGRCPSWHKHHSAHAVSRYHGTHATSCVAPLLVRLPLLIPEQRLADGRELVNVDGTVPVLKHI